MLFPGVFAGIFSSDPVLLPYASKVLRIYCGALLLMGLQNGCQLTFVSIGNASCSIIVAVVRKFVLLIPLIYIVPNFAANKAIGVYMAEPIADVLAVSFTVMLFSIQFKKALKSIEEPKPV